jgi:D-apionolactonase
MKIERGDWQLEVLDGALRAICWQGVEVVRAIDCPVRDENWGTYPQESVEESWDAETGVYRRTFRIAQDALRGRLQMQLSESGSLSAELQLHALREFSTNRAGFIVLHPIAGVAGTPLQVQHPDQQIEQTHFPKRISPHQPAVDIFSLMHEREGVRIEIAFAGEVFEMEDQRNWGDASFKTYCRPLALPTPYTLKAGEEVWQRIVVSATSRPPELLLAAESGWSDPDDNLGSLSLLLRLYGHETGTEDWLGAVTKGRAVDLEVVIPSGADPEQHLTSIAAALASQRVAPHHVIALPEAYLKSYPPSGPWPVGATPTEAARAARKAFPHARIGVGVLTNFAELNRCRPEPGVGDYLTFSATAIVHAADDRSVWETLETLPQILESAKALAPGLPIRLGLVSIGMRTNPYGATVAPNPERARKPMAQDDPRQSTEFAARYARAVFEVARAAGVEALALSSWGGSFEAQGALLQEIRRLSA